MSEESQVLVSREGAVAQMVINRPDKLNAIHAGVIAELTAALHTLQSDPAIRVVVVRGAGDRAFVAGADIAAMAEMNAEQARSFSAAGHRLGALLEAVRFVVIAQVQGFALGGGCELACACDLIFAGEKAKFGQPEVSLGVIPGFGGTQRLARRVGIGRARELVFRGNVIDAATAERIGLVERVFPQAELEAGVAAIATEIAAQAPVAIAQAKRVMRAGQDVPLTVANELESQAFGVCFGTEDQKTAMRSFVENPKTPRVFVGK